MPYLFNILVATGIASLIVVPAHAQENRRSDQQGELVFPTAQQVIDKHIRAIGGYEMVASRKNIHFVSNGYSSQGSKFVYEVYQTEGRFQSRFDFDDGRVIERGIFADGQIAADGKRAGYAWEIKNNFYREIVADERQEYLRRRSSISSVTRPLSYYKSVEFGSSESIDGREVYQLIFTDHDGQIIERYYDAKTGLPRRQICIEALSTGKVRVVRDFLDYEQFGEFVVSKKQVISQETGTQWVYQIELYEVDVKIPRRMFDLPASITASIAKAATQKALEQPASLIDEAPQPQPKIVVGAEKTIRVISSTNRGGK